MKKKEGNEGGRLGYLYNKTPQQEYKENKRRGKERGKIKGEKAIQSKIEEASKQ